MKIKFQSQPQTQIWMAVVVWALSGLSVDGSVSGQVVRCWGGNWFGQASEQQDLSGVSWVVAGGSHTIAIERDCYQTCTASVSGNCIVDGADLALLLAYWGPVNDSTASSVCDINVDGRVDGFDLGVLLNNWGPCPN